MLRLVLTPRWLGYLALTIVFSIVASLFGVWQWDRREQAVAKIEQVENHYDQPPQSLDELDLETSQAAQDLEWTPVTFSGEYLVEDQVLIRTRPRSGSVGFEVLVPILISSGEVVIVNRGWVPTGESQDFPDRVPEPPHSLVSVLARVKPPEPSLTGRSAPPGQLPSIDLVAYQDLLEYPIASNFYLELIAEDPAPTVSLVPFMKPIADEGPHLSYTLQWFVFALMAVVAYGWLLRSEYRHSLGVEPRSPRARSDADEEDALLDAR